MAFMATLHYDPDIFDNPEVYRYDRFAPTIVTISTTKNDSNDNDSNNGDET
eukprot:CAMPEP_0197832098 /NCGR_PEP_ID=MMETSP1437-20131217/13296_1 /TAXON_ID=49252 ORGANISM="Eucampia antarctica, Strain CCMP1452" /NCGR_SAMPLE_ID=MMETSP1437 /ASSEMBLY_ACC=CAM_ASM_001096 /LENGTH=50 /DNA_ID=CAMNT_0043435289 /DNA_START=95 /DNA_END=243 /DNA_ORIENTATION=-